MAETYHFRSITYLKPLRMKKNRINIEHELKCKHASIIWPLLSTDAGLKKWIADEVTRQGEQMTFTWGETWSHHEIKTAHVVEESRQERIRFVWDDETDSDAYWEMLIERSDITGDYILVVTDFALPEDEESLRDIWQQNFE